VVTRRAIFFDRDGVLSVPIERDGRTFAPLALADFTVYPEAVEALRRSREAGFLSIVVTNQPDVASGKVTRTEVEKMHEFLRGMLEIDDVEVSYDASGSDAPRRKPNPGMFLDSAAKWGISLESSFMIGDRRVDMQAARSAGCTAVFVDRNYANDPRPDDYDYIASDVLDAVLWCVAQESV
jgi:D-glycero-D-manno-heptose 1,7-bisphosphate phosphatase